jgi:hypothetical protein
MAVSRGATVTEWVDSSTPIGTSTTHTVDASTTMLIVAFGSEGDLTISSPVWNGSEGMTLIGSVVTSSSGGDVRVWLYGLVSPTTGAHTLSWSVAGGGDNAWAVAVNYLGTDTTSVAAATNLIDSEDNGNNASPDVAMSGSTTSGAALVIAGTFRGADGDPATESNDGNFADVATADTGGGSSTTDTSYYYGDDVDGGTGGTVSPTIDWTGSASDECVGVFAEILEAASSPTSTSTADVSLATYNPSSQTNHTMKLRARVTSGAGTATIRARLYEGGVAISSEKESSALTASLADYELAITDGEAATISDYSDLSIRFSGYDSGGASLTFEVAEVSLCVPEATASALAKPQAIMFIKT